jgi:hypothetical protein
VLVYGVISAVTEKSVDLCMTREEAEGFIAEVETDEPELAALLRVEEIELGYSGSGGPVFRTAPASGLLTRGPGRKSH